MYKCKKCGNTKFQITGKTTWWDFQLKEGTTIEDVAYMDKKQMLDVKFECMECGKKHKFIDKIATWEE